MAWHVPAHPSHCFGLTKPQDTVWHGFGAPGQGRRRLLMLSLQVGMVSPSQVPFSTALLLLQAAWAGAEHRQGMARGLDTELGWGWTGRVCRAIYMGMAQS